MFATKVLLLSLWCILLCSYCQSAPSSSRPFGRQMDFPDSEMLPEGSEGGSGGGFLQTIMDMLKNILGMDGNDSETGGLLSRIGKRIIGFISQMLKVITGDSSGLRVDGSSFPLISKSRNDIERELSKMSRTN